MNHVTTIAKATAANAAVVTHAVSNRGYANESASRSMRSYEASERNHGWRVEGSTASITTHSAI